MEFTLLIVFYYMSLNNLDVLLKLQISRQRVGNYLYVCQVLFVLSLEERMGRKS